MREIEFRGKYDGKWFYGSLYWDYFNTRYEIKFHDDLCDYDTGIIPDHDTIGQYTGLKDKNGTKIFEGDIVQLTRTKMRAPTASFNGQDIVSKHLIYWDEERHAFHQKHYTEERCIGGGSIDFEDVRAEENIIEVIGNIHDNPELLKE